jgi:rubredoxin
MAKVSPTSSSSSNNRDRASVAVYNHPAEPDNRQKRLEAPQPKSILKQPTPKFPEDPNAPREGVAPLKDATKKGIPPGARWTKIDRRLVSPAALEGQERFEERPDYVIVLRVLNKEEIHDYAVRTAKIRGKLVSSALQPFKI